MQARQCLSGQCRGEVSEHGLGHASDSEAITFRCRASPPARPYARKGTRPGHVPKGIPSADGPLHVPKDFYNTSMYYSPRAKRRIETV